MSGFIYFIAAETLGAVKVGFSGNHPSGRLRELQTGSAAPLKLLGFVPGTVEEERGLHKTFAILRIQGEWFRHERTLRYLISMLDPLSADEPSRRAVFDIAMERIAARSTDEEDNELAYFEMPLGQPFRGSK
jgi:hypothetical protein